MSNGVALRDNSPGLYSEAVPSSSEEWIPVARADEVGDRTTKKFFARVDGNEEECFLVKYSGKFYAYVNRCCHVPMTLDWVENRFFTTDGRYLQCATHGALYLPESGECVAGPPCGKFLQRLEVAVRDGVVYVFASRAAQQDRQF
ncbi:MAG: Rieske 2Fe-2S domain-containing protein [Candidatus Binatia bacterium]|nr:Rieske 2Fe-2S domain-containing protein [Candidatus Binatia bacterium]